jgi:hypothetical protein
LSPLSAVRAFFATRIVGLLVAQTNISATLIPFDQAVENTAQGYDLRSKLSAMRLLATLFIFLSMSNFNLGAQSEIPLYRSVMIDENGQLHIVLRSGRQILPPKLPGQVAFSDPGLSRDHRTVGWSADWPGAGQSYPYSGALVFYRSGHLLRKFSANQTFWSWQFANGDRDVAYCDGPTHGRASECDLRSLSSGHVVARWIPNDNDGEDDADLPAWAKDLHF